MEYTTVLINALIIGLFSSSQVQSEKIAKVDNPNLKYNGLLFTVSSGTSHHILVDEVLTLNIKYNRTENIVSNSVFLKCEVVPDEINLDRIEIVSDSNLIKYIYNRNGYWICDSECTIDLIGLFLGFGYVQILECEGDGTACESDSKWTLMKQEYEVAVTRPPRLIDIIFTVLLVAFGCMVNLGMGCQINLDVVKETLKRPIGPAIGFGCQFVFMPLLAFGYSRLFHLTPGESIGIFAIGCSPGGGMSNMWTLLLNGDISLSVTMTVLSTFSSLAMIPFWMYTLGRFITHGNFRIAFENIILSLIGISVPSVIGIAIQKYKPTWNEIITKVLKPLTILVMLLTLVVGTCANFYMFKLFNINLILAGACLPTSGYLLGFLVSYILKRPKSDIIAIGLETGIQNVSIAIISLKLSLPQPENDLSIVASVAGATFTPIPPTIALIGLSCVRLYKHWRK